MVAFRLRCCFVVVFLAVRSSTCARILCLFPGPSYSHQVVFRSLTEELARRGHQLVIGTTDPTYTKNPNVTEYNWMYLYQTWGETLSFYKIGGREFESQDMAKIFSDLAYVVLEMLYSTPELQNIFNNRTEKFDLLILEYFALPSFNALGRLLNVPMIGISSMDQLSVNHDIIGNTPHFVLYADTHYGKTLIPHSFYERLDRAMFGAWFSYYYRNEIIYKHDKLVKKYFGDRLGNLWDQDDKPDLVLINAHPALGFSRPVVPTVIDITGIHIQPVQPLPEEIKTYLDEATNGAVLLSLGSNVKSSLLAQDTKRTFLEGFSELPYKFIWKLDSNESMGSYDNLRTFSWMPQNDILSHPNVKLFIFQGGYQSLVEAVTHGVPMIGVPFVGDQFLNVEKILHYEIGLKWDLTTLNKDLLKQTITSVITDKKYRDNIRKISSQLYDSPLTPLERAVWWTEYVIRHNGTAHLDPLIPHLSWAQFLYLDMFTYYICIFLICAYLLYFIFRILYICIFNLVAPEANILKNKEE